MVKKKPTHLDASEMHKLDLGSRDSQLRSAAIKELDYKMALKEKQIEILRMENALHRHLKIEKNQNNESAKAKHLAFVEELKLKYDVTQLSYNPDTGEIHKEE